MYSNLFPIWNRLEFLRQWKTLEYFLQVFFLNWSECLSWQSLGQVRIWVMNGKQTRSNVRQLLCKLVKLRPSHLDHLYNLVYGIKLWHFITLNLTLWPNITFQSLSLQNKTSQLSPVVRKAIKKELLKICCLRWAFQSPLGPLVSWNRKAQSLYLV